MRRRSFLAGTGVSLAAGAGAARAAPQVSWKLVTSWPKNLPGPGTGAQRLADRIEAMSAGRIRIKLYAAGELAPALEVLDTVSRGAAEMGHTASFFWQGKLPAAVFFTSVPFGLTYVEHAAWIYHGGGQSLWDELYAPLQVKPFMAGNSGMSMGGWFKREVDSLDALRGLRYRIPGLGGEVLRRMGATPVLLPPSEIFSSLQTGAIDAAEFLGPWSDRAAGLYKAAPYYYWPGFHEPNGTAECLVNLDALAALPPDLRAVVENACQAENAFSLAETEWRNAESLEHLLAGNLVELRQFPAALITKARKLSAEVLGELGERDEMAGKILLSFEHARARAIRWSGISSGAFVNARGG